MCTLSLTSHVVLMYTIALAVMSRVSRSPKIDRVISVKEKITFDLEGQYQEIDLKSVLSLALSPGLVVERVERASVAPAMLMTLGSAPARGPSQYSRLATSSHSRSSTLEALPALPYGASSIAAFIPVDTGRASPPPSYTAAYPKTPRTAPATRRMRSLQLNCYAVEGQYGSRDSIAASNSHHRAYSHISSATIGGFPRPPQAVVLNRSSPDVYVLSPAPKTAVPRDLPPQLRPGTPATARAFDFPRTLTMYSVSTPSRADLCFTHPRDANGMTIVKQDNTRLTVRQSLGLSRQTTHSLQLPNPFSPERSATVMRSPTL